MLCYVLCVFIFCTLYCQFRWIVHFWLPLRCSLTFIQSYTKQNILSQIFGCEFMCAVYFSNTMLRQSWVSYTTSIWVSWWVCYKRQGQRAFQFHGHLVVDGVRVDHLFKFVFCVLFYLRTVSCVPSIADVSDLSISEYFFCFLWSLFKFYLVSQFSKPPCFAIYTRIYNVIIQTRVLLSRP